MAYTRFQEIRGLAEYTAKQVTENEREWKSFLDTASRFSKYPFKDQLLIYAQRPKATACASLEMWNERMNCWVNKGAKGIALIDDDGAHRSGLKYVFDVADVHEARFIGRKPKLWKMRQEHEEDVIASLENTYGEVQARGFTEGIIEMSERVATDMAHDYVTEELTDQTEGSFLDGLDEQSLEVRFRETLAASVAYVTLARSGADREVLDAIHFDYIHEFNSITTLSILGMATTDLAQPIITQIGRTVFAYDQIHEKELANNASIDYNALKRESVNGDDQSSIETAEGRERSGYETSIREERGLFDSEPEGERGAAGGTQEIRNDEEELSEGTSEGNLQRTGAERNAEGALPDDSEPGRGENGSSHDLDGEGAGSERGAKEQGPDDLGTEDERDSGIGGGDRSDGADLRLEVPEAELRQLNLTDLFPSFEEQMGTITAAEAGAKIAKPAAFSLSEEEINQMLCSGGGRNNSRKRIFAKYQEGKDPEQMRAVLRDEYGTVGKGFLFGDHAVSVWFDENGMKAGYGTSAMKNELISLSWEDVESRIRSLVESGEYIDRKEAFLVDETERNRIAAQIYVFFNEGMGYHPDFIPEESKYDYPTSIGHVSELLKTQEGRDGIAAEIEEAKAKLLSGEAELKWGYVKRPVELLEAITDLSADMIEFPLREGIEARKEDFITQDEIDWELRYGSGKQEGNFRIYKFFEEGHDTKENIAFLKDEYGIGGKTSALPGSDHTYEDHDAKGIRLTKGNLMEPYASVIIKWNIVEKRIRELIEQDNYISASDMEKLESRYLEEGQEEEFGEEELDEEGLEEETLAESEAEKNEIREEPTETPGNVTQVQEAEYREPENYRIHDEHLGAGTPKEKFRRNIEAIRTLETVEAEGRAATPGEQEIMAQYVGWGGLADAFDETKANWADEYKELKELLSPEEYASARGSTLNAHYTSPVVIEEIYEGLAKMGFEKGNILEPAMGIGNFFGMLPESMKDSKLYGVELDSITGRIAKQLYPEAQIKVTGFEKTDYPNDFFDVAVGNVPFGDYKVSDRQYDRNNFLIHDYFFAKSLDKVRPGGIVAFVTSKGTMDKQNPAVRKYLAQRAELLGAVRLPNTAFKENAGTEVTSDILFFKKRDRLVDLEPDWIHLSENADGIAMNDYFVTHPEMIVGKMEMVSGPYGMESTCRLDESRPFKDQLREAIGRIDARYEVAEVEVMEEMDAETIPADPSVKNYSYCLVDDKVYYRENSVMRPAGVADTTEQRIKGMISIRDCTQELISMQMEDYSDETIKSKQEELGSLYDDFTQKYGIISSQGNKRAFNQDSSYCLLCSLEKLDDEGNFVGKADMFTKRTIKRAEPVTSVDTASEALAVSLSEKAKVDLEYMSQLTGKSEEEVSKELAGVIFKNPVTEKWETADEYLSGNVRDKLMMARTFAESNPEYAVNVRVLEGVQPKELDASEIEVRIGATWVDPKYVNDFMRETFQTPRYLLNNDVVGVQYSPVTGQWNVKGKNADYGNALVHSTYGTSYANAYKILEDSLNLKDTRIYDTITEDGKEKRVLNKKETMLASQKQEMIREAFKDWVFRDQDRRKALVGKYNELFNSTRPREYDGSHLKFPGMSPDIELKPHQKNAVAHVLYGNNTLLAHCVGAGKTFEMTAAAMESKRLGLCQKSLFVVPNHLTEQWASDFLRLYPGANILAATKKDFEPANRKKFCSRIATGDYDAVIIGHSQFEKIPMSKERQVQIIERQIDDIETAIALTKAERGERYTIKEMEKTKKSLIVKLDKLNDESRKDNVVTFEQLGIDRLFVDESHNYKNLFLYTKMRNVAGIAQTEAQKSQDMFNKCQYLDELTGGKGVTFATGTPISNSMTELYTNMRYLQYSTLKQMGLEQFDSWAATFGETQTAIELAPEGTGYRAKTRFAKFFNLPELISLFKESADIQTPDMLKLPVPEAEYKNEVLKPSEPQKKMVQSLADRAEAVRNKVVDPSVDNMLKITNDGRKLALDQRLMADLLPDDENSKAAKCVDNAYEIWKETTDKKSTQLIFCDLSTPKGDGSFNIYDDIRDKLVAKGVPREEIAFIHEANTETRKAELFAKVRSGQVRFLLGSTAKMGAGTNVQDRLIALHHLDVPWRPSDIEQQEGRILRQGNQNPKVQIFRYVTEGTFYAYSWQLIENKQKFIGQIMTSKSPVRSCEDIDDAALSYAEVKALATGNPYIKEKMDLDIQVSKLKLLKANHTSQRYRMEDDIAVRYPAQITALKGKIEGLKADIGLYNSQKPEDPERFKMTVAGKTFEDRKEAGTAIIAMCREIKGWNTATEIGEYMGMPMLASFDAFTNRFTVSLKGSLSHEVDIGLDPSGNITRINNVLEGMGKKLEEAVTKLDNVEHQLETAKVEVKKPFAQEGEMNEKLSRLSELNALLNMDEKGDSPIAMDEEMPSQSKISVKQQIADNKTIVTQMGQKVIGLDGPKFAKGVAIGLE